MALSPDLAIGDFKRTIWGAREGMPDAVTALAQTRDGDLWLGNATGLFHFDGLGFERVNLPRDQHLASVQIHSLFAPASGGLWIGFTMGGVAFLNNGKLAVYTERDGLPRGSVKDFAVDHEGTLWIGANGGLAKQQGRRWQQMGADQGYTPGRTDSLLVDSTGTLWVLSRNYILSLARGQTVFQSSAAQAGFTGFESLAESPSGAVWICLEERLQLLRQNPQPTGPVNRMGATLSFDRDGGLWCKARDGSLQRIGRPQALQDVTRAQLKQWPSYSEDRRSALFQDAGIVEDQEGNIWSAGATGLVRYSQPRLKRVLKTGQEGFNAHTAAIVAGEDGGIWVADRFAPLIYVQDGKTTRYDRFRGHSSAYQGQDGVLWFAPYFGLRKYAAGQFERLALPDGTETEVQAITQRGPDLWVSIVRRGVFRLAGGVWTANGGLDALPKPAALTLATDAAGRIWFGYADGQIAMLDDDRVTAFHGASGLAVGMVTALYGRRTQIWAGGEFGLAVLDGSAFRSVITEDDGPALASVTGIIETATGDLWVNSSAGIVHFTAGQVRRIAEDPQYRPRGEIFNALDGLAGSSARLRPLPTAVEGSDGRLWFLTSAGLYYIDPARIQRNPVAPPVRIQTLQAGDRSYPVAADISLAQGTTSLRIGYVALSLTMAERVRYRYRLAGVDSDWQDAGGRREAFYTDLRPGHYRFQVIAANNDGVWNPVGATLAVHIPPTFLQTGWFIALCVAGAGLLIWLLAWLRVRQLAVRMRMREEERTAERERIARDLHDTLLQSTQGLILCVQAVTERLAADDPTRIALDQQLDRADAVLAEGRDRVLDLRIAAEPQDDLVDALTRAGTELAHGRAVVFRMRVEGTPRGLQPLAREEAYRIGREALLNAFRHAQATTIEIQVGYDADALEMRIGDDGVGIDASTLETGARPDHWGLRGLRERAQRVGAALHVRSQAGAGAEVSVRIPAARAYQTQPRRRWWWRG